uniref:Eukaryotic translation initiation factor 3 subunit J n=1 Tax=Rhizophora mucronata TaxID=61149 RepID=A0A2P2JWB9_RHIMU
MHLSSFYQQWLLSPLLAFHSQLLLEKKQCLLHLLLLEKPLTISSLPSVS